VKATVLIVEDEENARQFLAQLLRDSGYDVIEAGTLGEADKVLARGDAEVVLLDVQLPDGYGPDLLSRLHREQPSLPVIMITGYGDIDMAVAAMNNGALDFIQKPVKMARLKQSLDRAVETISMRRELEYVRGKRDPLESFIFGETAAMKKLLGELRVVAQTNATVLLTGESGTGKEVMANTVHALSKRVKGPWRPVNCANFSDTLLESELFGYEVGAFTGATKRKNGLFLEADGGTVFLDEISTMRPELQAKLLRVLEERAVRRLGGSTEIKIDVRIIAATNRDLADMVTAGTFREDLFHRLNVVQLRLPALRDRTEDIPPLVGYFIKHYNAEMGKRVEGAEPNVFAMLKAYTWPGNIRQLRNAVERAMLFAEGEHLQVGHFPPEIIEATSAKA
jgi:DNA-binding NtrC family response regulator